MIEKICRYLREHALWFLGHCVPNDPESRLYDDNVIAFSPLTRSKISWMEPADFSDFEFAVQILRESAPNHKLGIYVRPPIVVAELLDAVDESGHLYPWAQEHINRYPTRWESAPLQGSIRGFFGLPGGATHWSEISTKRVHIRRPGWFCIVTGDVVPGSFPDVEPITLEDLAAFGGLVPEMRTEEGVQPDTALIIRPLDEEQSDPDGDRAFTQDQQETRISIVKTDRQLRHLLQEYMAAVTAKNSPPVLFSYGEKLVRIANRDGEIIIRNLSTNEFIAHLAGCADFHTLSGIKLTAAKPDRDVAAILMSFQASELRLPKLVSIARTPIFRPDGSLLSEPGFDESTGIYYSPGPGLEGLHVDSEISASTISAAVDLLLDTIHDFHFLDHASKVHFLACLISGIISNLVDLIPLLAVRAPQQAAGKTLLCKLMHMICEGDEPALYSAPRASDEEWEKRLFSILRRGPRFIVFDNLTQILESHALAKILTSRKVASRILGESEVQELEHNALIIANGNNLSIGQDLRRRTYWILLDSATARPHLAHHTWKHDPLLGWAKQNRRGLLEALLTLVRAWFVAGQPAGDNPGIPSYEQWSTMVGGILANAGVPGFLDNYESMFEEADPSEQQFEHFWTLVRVHNGGLPFTSSELLLWIRTLPALQEALPEPLHVAVEKNRAILLGNELSKIQNRRFGRSGIRISPEGLNRNKVMLWRVAIEV